MVSQVLNKGVNMVICNHVGKCTRFDGCPHGIPHEPLECFIIMGYRGSCSNWCVHEDVCPTTKLIVKCIEIEEN